MNIGKKIDDYVSASRYHGLKTGTSGGFATGKLKLLVRKR